MEARAKFTEEIEQVYNRVLQMAGLVEEALHKALNAFSGEDEELAEKVVAEDAVVDALQVEIENDVTRVIATESPVARDLRELMTATKIASNLERIGDHARHIAKDVGTFSRPFLERTLPSIEKMADLGISMMHDAISAFIQGDDALATDVAARDDEIDKAHRALYKDIAELAREYPDHFDEVSTLLYLNRFLERLGDHVTTICELVVFAQKGEHVELN